LTNVSTVAVSSRHVHLELDASPNPPPWIVPISTLAVTVDPSTDTLCCGPPPGGHSGSTPHSRPRRAPRVGRTAGTAHLGGRLQVHVEQSIGAVDMALSSTHGGRFRPVQGLDEFGHHGRLRSSDGALGCPTVPGATHDGPRSSRRNRRSAGRGHWLVLTAARSWVGDVIRVDRPTVTVDVTAAGSTWR